MEGRVNVLDWIRNPSLMIDWLRVKMSDFFTLPARIAALKVKAMRMREILLDRDPLAAAQLTQVQQSLGQLQSDQTAMQSRVSTLLSRLGALGIKMPGSGLSGYYDFETGLGILPVIPLVLIATGGAVALGIAAIFSNYKKQARIVSAVERGTLTAEEAKTLGAGKPLFGFDIGAIGTPILLLGGLAALAFLAGPTVRKRFA